MTEDLPDENSFPRERYKPVGRLGSGSMGSVYKCTDKLLSRTVSVKILNNLNEAQIIDFQREARALSSLQHPGIVSVLDFGSSENGAPYLVMEYIEGETLANRLAREGPLPVEIALDIFIQRSELRQKQPTQLSEVLWLA